MNTTRQKPIPFHQLMKLAKNKAENPLPKREPSFVYSSVYAFVNTGDNNVFPKLGVILADLTPITNLRCNGKEPSENDLKKLERTKEEIREHADLLTSEGASPETVVASIIVGLGKTRKITLENLEESLKNLR